MLWEEARVGVREGAREAWVGVREGAREGAVLGKIEVSAYKGGRRTLSRMRVGCWVSHWACGDVLATVATGTVCPAGTLRESCAYQPTLIRWLFD